VTVEDTSTATKLLASGATETLDPGTLSEGTYTLFCSLPGHEAAGMRATLRVV